MPTIAAVYTAQALVEPLNKMCQENLPAYRLVNIIDDSLIQDVIREGKVQKDIVKRLLHYYQAAVDLGADVILNTCSSVGEVVDLARPFIDIPILKIDEPMAAQAVKTGNTIGVIATLPTTLKPTCRLVEKEAVKIKKSVKIVEGLAEGGYAALVAGDVAKHDQLILETAKRTAQEADVIVLAQGSMYKMEERLRQETGKIVLSSPLSGLLAVKSFLERG